MWQTPLSIVSPRNSMPCDSSCARASRTSSTWSAIGFGLRLAEGLGLQDLQGEGAGLELAAGHLPVVLGLLEAEDVAVEVLCRVEVGDGDVGEVDARDADCSGGHAEHRCANRICACVCLCLC